ncbi:heterokaryon incompatibility protein-domain-containing protein [Aspergillus lucknowensis]|uniref:Heterokaryon incompatibility protein-domain-containing protein n=1 Tax=Aspergillus lucknowensis TaxID=176173 RepID=A0ABR4LPJ3_9EURO
MYRWHESGCRRPDVSTARGIPGCGYCFAISPLAEDALGSPPLPQLRHRSWMNLAWPSIVAYSDWGSEEEITDRPDGNRSELYESKPSKSLLPELPFDDSIRLLRLKCGPADSPIHADLETVRVNQILLPLYEALSYTSVSDPANSSESCPVFIGNYWDVTYVSTSCGNALRRLRRQKVDRLLWVDSLCIDHTRPEEKNRQVHILREIYSRAAQVLAYVGHKTADYSAAFRFLKEITAFQPPSHNHPATLDKNVRSSLQALLREPYFSRIWVLQETLMARDLKIVCGNFSARWPKKPFGGSHPDLDVPSWLFRDSKWYPFTGSDLLDILVDASRYKCSDPRDKVFALLGLMGEKYIGPEYHLPVENVYVGISAYLIKNCRTMNLFALAGQTKKAFNLPSWVPDWSQRLSPPSLDNFLRLDDQNDANDEILDGATRLKFENLGQADCDIEISSATGTLQLRGFKLCKVFGEISRVRDYTHVQVPLGDKGSFIISIPHQSYEVSECDNLFLLNGYNHPVILRDGVNPETYTLVSTSVVSVGCPAPKLLIPWYRRLRVLQPSSQLITVSALTREDGDSLHQLYSRLEPLPATNSSTVPPNTATIRARALSFLMLTQTTIQKVEKWLRVDWNKWNRELGWMFRDQSAVWQFLLETNQLSADEQSGEDRINLRGPDRFAITQSGKEFPTSYNWDLTRFCWAFLQPLDITHSGLELQWSPMVDQLRSHCSEIQQWAQVTEQLLKVFEYSSAALGDDWETFPGARLSPKWSANYRNFLAACGPNLRQETQGRPQLEPDCLWSIAEFERHLRAREEIWGLRGLDERRLNEKNIEAHALLNFLGMDLYSEQRIKIE